MNNLSLRERAALIAFEALLRKEYRELAYTSKVNGKTSVAEFISEECFQMADLFVETSKKELKNNDSI